LDTACNSKKHINNTSNLMRIGNVHLITIILPSFTGNVIPYLWKKSISAKIVKKLWFVNFIEYNLVIETWKR
jgi:hypothetical protein